MKSKNGSSSSVVGAGKVVKQSLYVLCESKAMCTSAHYHKRRAFNGAERRLASKVKLCKTIKEKDAILCNQLSCIEQGVGHYHVVVQNHGIGILGEGIANMQEQVAGENDAQLELRTLTRTKFRHSISESVEDDDVSEVTLVTDISTLFTESDPCVSTLTQDTIPVPISVGSDVVEEKESEFSYAPPHGEYSLAVSRPRSDSHSSSSSGKESDPPSCGFTDYAYATHLWLQHTGMDEVYRNTTFFGAIYNCIVEMWFRWLYDPNEHLLTDALKNVTTPLHQLQIEATVHQPKGLLKYFMNDRKRTRETLTRLGQGLYQRSRVVDIWYDLANELLKEHAALRACQVMDIGEDSMKFIPYVVPRLTETVRKMQADYFTVDRWWRTHNTIAWVVNVLVITQRNHFDSQPKRVKAGEIRHSVIKPILPYLNGANFQ